MIVHVILFFLLPLSAVESDLDKEAMLDRVNYVRSQGCKCGSKKMPPVDLLAWSETLQKSAFSHAQDMDRNKYFSHYSRKGEDVGRRVDQFNYNWLVIGENIAEGQKRFDEVLNDWLKSPPHCKMIMDGKVDEMGISRSGKYWVQHFGKRRS